MAKTKADLIDELSVGRTDEEVKELESMSKVELEEISEAGTAVPATEGLDETVEGGRYKVGDQVVNAAGEKVK